MGIGTAGSVGGGQLALRGGWELFGHLRGGSGGVLEQGMRAVICG